MLGNLDSMTAKCLENRAARIGAELETSAAIELVHGPHQRHVAFADQVCVFTFTETNTLGHGQDERQISFGNLLAVRSGGAIPTEQFLGLFSARGATTQGLLDPIHPVARVVELHEDDAFLGSGKYHAIMSARRSGADVVHHGSIPTHGGTRNGWSLGVDALLGTGLVEVRVIHEIDFVGEQFAEERCIGPRALRFGWLGWLGQLGLNARDRRERRARWTWQGS